MLAESCQLCQWVIGSGIVNGWLMTHRACVTPRHISTSLCLLMTLETGTSLMSVTRETGTILQQCWVTIQWRSVAGGRCLFCSGSTALSRAFCIFCVVVFFIISFVTYIADKFKLLTTLILGRGHWSKSRHLWFRSSCHKETWTSFLSAECCGPVQV